MIDDPFAVSSEIKAPEIVKEWSNVYRGRYYLPAVDDPSAWLPGYEGKQRPWGWMRTTNLVGAYVDTRALHEWEVEMGLKGLIERHDLYEELCTRFKDSATRREYNALFERAKDAAKASVAAERGTLRHDMVEQWLTSGKDSGSPFMLLQLQAYREALRQHCLQPVPELTERVIVNNYVECAGKFDCANINLLNGDLIIGDLKSKRRSFFTLLELRAQLAVYARADGMWDAEQCCYVDPPSFNLDIGHIFHMPVNGDEETGAPVVHVLELDLAAGWETAKRAHQIVKDRSEARSRLTLASARRPLPVPTVEMYARWLSDVSTLQEGSRLVAEARERGVWCAELEQTAAAVVLRLTRQGPGETAARATRR